MAEVIVFHHAQGLTPGVVAFADELRRAGHTVRTPDLFEGRTFTTVEEGVQHASEIGFGEVLERGVRAADALPAASAGPSAMARAATGIHHLRSMRAPFGLIAACSWRYARMTVLLVGGRG